MDKMEMVEKNQRYYSRWPIMACIAVFILVIGSFACGFILTEYPCRSNWANPDVLNSSSPCWPRLNESKIDLEICWEEHTNLSTSLQGKHLETVALNASYLKERKERIALEFQVRDLKNQIENLNAQIMSKDRLIGYYKASLEEKAKFRSQFNSASHSFNLNIIILLQLFASFILVFSTKVAF